MSQFFYKFKSFALQIHQTLNQFFREGELREKLFSLEKEIEKTSIMEDLQKLLLQKEMLLIELNSIERKINLLDAFKAHEKITTVTDVPESSKSSKTEASPESTVSGKDLQNPDMDVAFPKSKNKIVDFQSTTSPAQTETGKDKSTPLMVDALPKSMLAELPKDLKLRPLWSEICENKNLTVKTDERFYVIYNGATPGIYSDWGIVQKLVSGKPVAFKKFKTIVEARKSAQRYSTENQVDIKTADKILQPNLNKKKTFERPLIKEVPKALEMDKTISHFDFEALWLKIRNLSVEDFSAEKIYSLDKKTISYYNFCEGCDPNLLLLAYNAGLVKNIYPSINLLELRYFPEKIKNAIKNFRTKVAKKTDVPIYVNITSSLPEWENEQFYEPYRFIEIGLAKKDREVNNPIIFEDDHLPQEEVLSKLRTNNLILIIKKLIAVSADTKIKVNFCDKNTIITSWCPVKINDQDTNTFLNFEELFKNNNIMAGPMTKQKLCDFLKKTYKKHHCASCQSNNGSKNECDATSSSTTEDKD